MWEYLDLIRVYTKPKGKDPDYEAPVILPRLRSSVEDFCHKIHRNMIRDFRYAMIWGTSVKFNPQKVGKEHVLLDEDVVQIIKKIWCFKGLIYLVCPLIKIWRYQDLSGSRYLGTSANVGLRVYSPGPGLAFFSAFNLGSLENATFPLKLVIFWG